MHGMSNKRALPYNSALQGKSWQRACLSLFAVGLVYANLSVIFNSPLQPYVRVRALPLFAPVQDGFLIFGVFSYYETNNTELTICVFPTTPKPGAQKGALLTLFNVD